MKKLLVFILSILYLGASTGTTLHLHYCMGKLVNEQSAQKETGKCSKCGMKKDRAAKKGCCKDEHKLVKLEKDQKTTETVSFSDPLVLTVPPSYMEWPAPELPVLTTVEAVSHAPPRTGKVQPYIFYCSFLI
jgi:hypothetical protein